MAQPEGVPEMDIHRDEQDIELPELRERPIEINSEKTPPPLGELDENNLPGSIPLKIPTDKQGHTLQ